MRRRGQTKGIFCIEGMWDTDLRTPSSVEPLLDLLNLNALIDYIHVDCATVLEFEFYIRKWMQKRYNRFPILYLAMHGSASELQIGRESFSVERLGELMEGKCANRFIMFSSCSTMRIDKRVLKSFLRRTEALAVCGYRVDVNWLWSTAFELLLLSEIQRNEFSGRGAEAIGRAASRIARAFKELDFSIVTVKDL